MLKYKKYNIRINLFLISHYLVVIVSFTVILRFSITAWCNFSKLCSNIHKFSNIHTGEAIKYQFTNVAEKWGLTDKVFKIVADQAANFKKSFKDKYESEDIFSMLIDSVERKDLIKATKMKSKEEQNMKVIQLNEKIESNYYYIILYCLGW